MLERKRAQMLRLQRSSTVNPILTLISITQFTHKPAGVLIFCLFQMLNWPRDHSGTWSPLLSLTNKFNRVNKTKPKNQKNRSCQIIDLLKFLVTIVSHKSVWLLIKRERRRRALVELPESKWNKPGDRTEWLCVAGKKVRTRNRSRHQNVSWLYKWLLNDTLSETKSSLRTQWGPYDVSQAHGRVSLTALPTGWPQDAGHRAASGRRRRGGSGMTGRELWSLWDMCESESTHTLLKSKHMFWWM